MEICALTRLHNELLPDTPHKQPLQRAAPAKSRVNKTLLPPMNVRKVHRKGIKSDTLSLVNRHRPRKDERDGEACRKLLVVVVEEVKRRKREDYFPTVKDADNAVGKAP